MRSLFLFVSKIVSVNFANGNPDDGVGHSRVNRPTTAAVGDANYDMRPPEQHQFLQ